MLESSLLLEREDRMKSLRCVFAGVVLLFLLGLVIVVPNASAHVTIQTDRPLRPHTTVRVQIVVPNESDTDTTEVSLSVPDAFLAAGGRLSRVDFPAGWQVKIDKEDAANDPSTPDNGHNNVNSAARRSRIKKVTFSGGAIPPDGFKVFYVELQLPDQPGQFRFPAVQTYAGGKVISWSELIPGAAHPAPTVTIERQPSVFWTMQSLALLLSGVAILGVFYQALKRRP